MATPRRIFRLYDRLKADAPLIAEFLSAKGDKIPGTVNLLLKGDAAKLLAKWGEEMHELCGVLDGSHDDPFTMESTQTYYWASLYAVTLDSHWEDLRFDEQFRAAATCGVSTIPELRTAVDRLVALGAPAAKPEKLFLLWSVAFHLYEAKTPVEDRFTLEQICEIDLQDMKKRAYLEPVLAAVPE